MMKQYIMEHILSLKTDQADTNAIHDGVVAGVRLKGAPLIILFCAIMIASVGLNTNSTAVVIGAMLISPLMSPIIGIGYSIATYDGRLLRNAAINFGTQIVIALAGATLYFLLTPQNVPTAELIARTSPSFFDMLIAFFGGAAGVIGITRREKSNVIPGVAIATALMPPMCTVGYGIANLNPEFIWSAAYLFAINAFFICFATFIGCKLLQLKQAPAVAARYNKIIKYGIIVGIILIAIPGSISAFIVGTSTIQANILNNNVDSFVTAEINTDTTTLMNATVDKQTHIIRMDLVGEPYSDTQITRLQSDLSKYGLDGYQLHIVQDLNRSVFDYFHDINAHTNKAVTIIS